MAKKEEILKLDNIVPKVATITIVGDSDLIINKMNNPTANGLIAKREDKSVNVTEKVNPWEEIITSVHWEKPLPDEFSEEIMHKMLAGENTPCISAFGLYKSFADAVTRFGVDQYSTKFKATVNVTAKGNLVPIRFTEHYIDKQLMSPQKGSPVLVRLNRFTGWSADITIRYIDTVYSLEQIINIVNLAGFGLGIGSGRSSGYGRYHIENVQ